MAEVAALAASAARRRPSRCRPADKREDSRRFLPAPKENKAAV